MTRRSFSCTSVALTRRSNTTYLYHFSGTDPEVKYHLPLSISVAKINSWQLFELYANAHSIISHMFISFPYSSERCIIKYIISYHVSSSFSVITSISYIRHMYIYQSQLIRHDTSQVVTLTYHSLYLEISFVNISIIIIIFSWTYMYTIIILISIVIFMIHIIDHYQSSYQFQFYVNLHFPHISIILSISI